MSDPRHGGGLHGSVFTDYPGRTYVIIFCWSSFVRKRVGWLLNVKCNDQWSLLITSTVGTYGNWKYCINTVWRTSDFSFWIQEKRGFEKVEQHFKNFLAYTSIFHATKFYEKWPKPKQNDWTMSYSNVIFFQSICAKIKKS